MIADKMKGMVANSSAIRAMFEEGNRLASLYGAENVYDFSLGNPNVPAPEAVKKPSWSWWKVKIPLHFMDIPTVTVVIRRYGRQWRIL